MKFKESTGVQWVDWPCYLLLLQALILKLKDPDPNPGVVISVLATIGELAQVMFQLLEVFWGQYLCVYYIDSLTAGWNPINLSRILCPSHIIMFFLSHAC